LAAFAPVADAGAVADGATPGGVGRARSASPCTAGGGVAVVGLLGLTIFTFGVGAVTAPAGLLA
jgi:hypothetical protein